MRTLKTVLGFASAAILGGVLIFRAPAAPPIPAKEVKKLKENRPGATSIPATIPTTTLAAATPVQRQSASLAAKRFEGQRELEDYKLLKKKIFLTDQEKSQMQQLLRNEAFTLQIQKLFNVPNEYENEYENLENQQNTAIDFLLAALEGQNSAVAGEVLKSIIQDPGTEDQTLSLPLRENLAGVKAEVLYRWSALDPVKATEMQQWLPGPVSLKIWKNILAQQEMNRAESAEEKTR